MRASVPALLLVMTACASSQATEPATPNLSRRMQQPGGLDAALATHYPPAARQHGIEGEARVRFGVDRQGKVTSLQLVSESHPLFGPACMQMLAGSRGWQPALDRSGRPVDAQAHFTCKFEIAGPTAPLPPASLAEGITEHAPRDQAGQRLAGSARLELTITADGQVGESVVSAQTAAPFGDACRDLVTRHGPWTPARDEHGNPVSVRIPFKCEFHAEAPPPSAR